MAPGWIPFDSEEAREARSSGWKPGWVFNAKKHEFVSPYGFAQHRVQLKSNGSVDFDRVVYGESPNINAVVWGYALNLEILVGVLTQARPFADNPDGTPADPPIRFAQCVMGFNLERVAGADAAAREAGEEAGAGSAIIEVREMGYHNPGPSFCATWSQLFEIRVEIGMVNLLKIDHSELIYKLEFIPLYELMRRIAAGQHEGVSYRSATANDAFLVFLARHPEFFVDASGK